MLKNIEALSTKSPTRPSKEKATGKRLRKILQLSKDFLETNFI